MPRQQRPHVPGGTYYVVQHGIAEQPIFSHPTDYTALERLLPGVLRRTGARIHAYCWVPNAIHLVLQIEEISVGRFMQGLTGRYARHLQRRTGQSVHHFRHPYQAALIDPGQWLLKLTQFVHYVPVLSGLVEEPDAYANSSHHAYVKGVDEEIPWLYMRGVVRGLGASKDAYRELMSQPPTQSDLEQFYSLPPNAYVIGGPAFMATLPRRAHRSNGSLDEIIDTVTSALGVKREHVLSRSRNREPALARALIAWYASERGVATLTEVARRVRRDPSTLSMAISRYRVSRPELFKLNALHYVESGGEGQFPESSGEGELPESADEHEFPQHVSTGEAGPSAGVGDYAQLGKRASLPLPPGRGKRAKQSG